jgi:alcohol dehydrogenase class IV
MPPMNPFTFQVPPNILFEPGAAAKIPGLVGRVRGEARAARHRSGRARRRADAGGRAGLAAQNCGLVVFDEVEADPPAHVVERAARWPAPKAVDLVLSIGGGSALDTAKLVAYLAPVGRASRRHLRRRARRRGAPAASARADRPPAPARR